MGKNNAVKGKLKDAFAHIGNGIKEDFDKLRHGFTVRSFFTLLFGFALLVVNAYLFVASAIELFGSDGFFGLPYFFVGLIGFLFSCILIFMISVHFSVSPQSSEGAEVSGIMFEKMPSGSQKVKRIAIIILFFLFTFGGGGTALGFYIAGEVKYSSYPQTTATIVSLLNSGNDDEVYAFYEYTVDGITYKTSGELKSGESAPRIGDTVTIRYNPLNPSNIRINTESKFLLGFGCFLMYCGLMIIVVRLYKAKILNTQFLLAFILLGLSACIFTAFLCTTEFHGLIAFLGRNFVLHFVLIFTNVGILELINGIVYIGYKKRAKPKKRRKRY